MPVAAGMVAVEAMAEAVEAATQAVAKQPDVEAVATVEAVSTQPDAEAAATAEAVSTQPDVKAAARHPLRGREGAVTAL